MFDALLQTGLAFGLFFLMFLPLEQLFAIRRQRVFRRQWLTDFAFFLGQYLLWTAPVVACLVWLQAELTSLPMGSVHAWVRAQPGWLQVVLAVAVSDLCIYWGHRLSHQIDFLWRFHKVHHTAVTLDWLAAHREHPVDNLYTRTIENLPPILLGLSMESIAGFIAFRGIWGLFIHSNVTIPMGPLKYFLGSPRLHHWHHSTENEHCNYANLMPVMDLIFGTYFEPSRMPKAYGLKEDVPHDYLTQLVAPLTVDGLTGPVRAPDK